MYVHTSVLLEQIIDYSTAAPPKEEQNTQETPSEDTKGDKAEPSDQQVDKKLPDAPSPEPKNVQGGGTPSGGNKKDIAKGKDIEKDVKKSDKGKESKESKEKPKPAVAGSRNVTRASLVLHI